MTGHISHLKRERLNWGPPSVLVTNVLLYLVLTWLARSTADPFDRTLLLAIANLVLASALLFPIARKGPLLLDRTTNGALLGWSIAYCIIYGAFVRWPQFIPVWGLVAAQACAPLVAVFVSGDHRREPVSLRRRFVFSSPVVFLLAIAVSQWKSSPHMVYAPNIALGLVLLFTFSQSCARVVARNAPSAVWGPPRLAMLNGTILLSFWLAFGQGAAHTDRLGLLRSAVLLSMGIFAVQAFYLLGLAKTTSSLSALLLSTAVPISIFGDFLLKNRPSRISLALVLSVGFSVATGLVAWATSEPKVARLAAAPASVEAE